MDQEYPEGKRDLFHWSPLTTEASDPALEGKQFYADTFVEDFHSLKTADAAEETPWVPALGERYFLVDVWCKVGSNMNADHNFDKQFIACGNVFKTRELAEQAVIRVLAAYKG